MTRQLQRPPYARGLTAILFVRVIYKFHQA
jgi:hypothetical protein